MGSRLNKQRRCNSRLKHQAPQIKYMDQTLWEAKTWMLSSKVTTTKCLLEPKAETCSSAKRNQVATVYWVLEAELALITLKIRIRTKCNHKQVSIYAMNITHPFWIKTLVVKSTHLVEMQVRRNYLVLPNKHTKEWLSTKKYFRKAGQEVERTSLL